MRKPLSQDTEVDHPVRGMCKMMRRQTRLADCKLALLFGSRCCYESSSLAMRELALHWLLLLIAACHDLLLVLRVALLI